MGSCSEARERIGNHRNACFQSQIGGGLRKRRIAVRSGDDDRRVGLHRGEDLLDQFGAGRNRGCRAEGRQHRWRQIRGHVARYLDRGQGIPERQIQVDWPHRGLQRRRPGPRCQRGIGGEHIGPGVRDRRFERPLHGPAVHALLIDRLRSTDVACLVRTVGGHDDQRDSCEPGFDDCGEVLGGGRSGRADESDRKSRRLCHSQGEKGGRAFIVVGRILDSGVCSKRQGQGRIARSR